MEPLKLQLNTWFIHVKELLSGAEELLLSHLLTLLICKVPCATQICTGYLLTVTLCASNILVAPQHISQEAWQTCHSAFEGWELVSNCEWWLLHNYTHNSSCNWWPIAVHDGSHRTKQMEVYRHCSCSTYLLPFICKCIFILFKEGVNCFVARLFS